jgi:hypothetical protein
MQIQRPGWRERHLLEASYFSRAHNVCVPGANIVKAAYGIMPTSVLPSERLGLRPFTREKTKDWGAFVNPRLGSFFARFKLAIFFARFRLTVLLAESTPALLE